MRQQLIVRFGVDLLDFASKGHISSVFEFAFESLCLFLDQSLVAFANGHLFGRLVSFELLSGLIAKFCISIGSAWAELELKLLRSLDSLLGPHRFYLLLIGGLQLLEFLVFARLLSRQLNLLRFGL